MRLSFPNWLKRNLIMGDVGAPAVSFGENILRGGEWTFFLGHFLKYFLLFFLLHFLELKTLQVKSSASFGENILRCGECTDCTPFTWWAFCLWWKVHCSLYGLTSANTFSSKWTNLPEFGSKMHILSYFLIVSVKMKEIIFQGGTGE